MYARSMLTVYVSVLSVYYIDYIKFDGSLIRKLVENSKVQLFIGNLKYLCDNIEVLTVAEYVEN